MTILLLQFVIYYCACIRVSPHTLRTGNCGARRIGRTTHYVIRYIIMRGRAETRRRRRRGRGSIPQWKNVFIPSAGSGRGWLMRGRGASSASIAMHYTLRVLNET